MKKEIGNLIVESFAVGSYGCNCSLIYHQGSSECLAIDPGNDSVQFLKEVKSRGLKVTHLLHTHAHFDHIGDSTAIHKEISAKVCLHREDLPLYQMLPQQGLMFRQKVAPPGEIHHFIQDEEEFKLENKKISCLHTPGHTPGSTCFYLETSEQPIVFSGDTLFLHSIGRTDFPGGSFEQIVQSINQRLFHLPEESLVITGHGPTTTIGQEKYSNPFVGKRR